MGIVNLNVCPKTSDGLKLGSRALLKEGKCDVPEYRLPVERGEGRGDGELYFRKLLRIKLRKLEGSAILLRNHTL